MFSIATILMCCASLTCFSPLDQAVSLQYGGVAEYISTAEPIPFEPEVDFELAETRYVIADILNVRSVPNVEIEYSKIGKLTFCAEVLAVEFNEEWSAILHEGELAFVASAFLSEESPSIITYSIVRSYSGDVLSKKAGTIQGPSGKETYYNLNMNGCVKRMHKLGYSGEYWIRDDGVKMFGEYVMIAADFETRPLGSLIETSLGTGIVVDTGLFAEANPTQIDIAVNW